MIHRLNRLNVVKAGVGQFPFGERSDLIRRLRLLPCYQQVNRVAAVNKLRPSSVIKTNERIAEKPVTSLPVANFANISVANISQSTCDVYVYVFSTHVCYQK